MQFFEKFAAVSVILVMAVFATHAKSIEDEGFFLFDSGANVVHTPFLETLVFAPKSKIVFAGETEDSYSVIMQNKSRWMFHLDRNAGRWYFEKGTTACLGSSVEQVTFIGRENADSISKAEGFFSIEKSPDSCFQIGLSLTKGAFPSFMEVIKSPYRIRIFSDKAIAFFKKGSEGPAIAVVYVGEIYENEDEGIRQPVYKIIKKGRVREAPLIDESWTDDINNVANGY